MEVGHIVAGTLVDRLAQYIVAEVVVEADRIGWSAPLAGYMEEAAVLGSWEVVLVGLLVAAVVERTHISDCFFVVEYVSSELLCIEEVVGQNMMQQSLAAVASQLGREVMEER